MNGYVEAGYVVILGTLGTYSVTLVARERAARRRASGPTRGSSSTVVGVSPGDVAGVPPVDARVAGDPESSSSL
jgi:hypothetical protein